MASFIQRLYRVGDKEEPWGITACIYIGVDIRLSMEALNFLWEGKCLMCLTVLMENCNLNDLYYKPGCRVISKALLMSKNTAAVGILFTYMVTWSVSLILIHCNGIWDLHGPNWPALRRPSSAMCRWIIFTMSFSNSSPFVDKRLVGNRFWENLRSLA